MSDVMEGAIPGEAFLEEVDRIELTPICSLRNRPPSTARRSDRDRHRA
jgi:hypothetical protein